MVVKGKKIVMGLSQCAFETLSWIRFIEFLTQENSHLKNRLSEVIDQIKDRQGLAMAEHFQNQFIIKDDVYDHLLYDLRNQMQKWERLSHENKVLNQELKKNHLQLKDQIEFVKRDHQVMESDFNSYISEVIHNNHC